MSVNLTARQKNIVNPYADQTFQDRFEGQVGVAAYEYNEIRNKFVLDAIHDSYINFQNFPRIGQVLNPDISVTEDQSTITPRDARAYFSLYPQNGRLTTDPVTGEQSMVPWGGDEANAELDTLVVRLIQNGVLENYTTLTTELSQADENTPDRVKNRNNLLALKPNHSFPYLSRLRASLGLSTEDILNISEDPLENTLLAGDFTTFISSDANVNLYDWVDNTQPGTDKEKVYFNVVDNRFYYVVRTEQPDFAALDIAWVVPEITDRAVFEKHDAIADRGIDEILKFSGRFSSDNKEAVKHGRAGLEAPEYLQYNLEEDDPPRMRRYNLFTSKDPRPGSRWVAAVTISKDVVDNLPVEQAISFEDEELSAYERSKVIVNREKTSLLQKQPRFYENLSLARKLEDVYELLIEYSEQLREESIGPILTNNVDLEQEALRIDTFYDLFGTFYSFNKLSLQDDDLVQFYFNSSYELLYVCINGIAYTRGTGNAEFQRISDDEEDNEPTAVLNAFSFLTSTTFSYIYNAFEISEEFLISTPDTRRPWTTFLPRFTFPTLDVSPEKIDQLKRNESTYNLRNTLAQQKNIFTALSKVSRMPADKREQLFDERKRFLFLSDAVFSAGCDSGAATVLQETLVALAVLDGRISIRTYLRKIIRLLQREVIQDETAKRILLAGASADPAVIGREVQRLIESQIFCALDVLGGTLGSAVLQATDSPPVANELSRVVKNPSFSLEFKKIPLQNKQNKAKKAYRTVINQIITNFLKSLVATMARDLIKAVAGCAPESQDDLLDELQDAFRKYNYGSAELEELVEELDIVQIAKDVDLVNVSEEIVDGETVVSKSDPTVEQLQELIEDVSKMITATEAAGILGGDADDLLYRLIVETLTHQNIRWPVGVQPVDPGDQNVGEQIIQAIKDEFLGEDYEFIYEYIDPAPYNTFVITKEKIRDFFAAIGAALGQLDSDNSEAAIEQFCRDRDPDLTTLKLRLSEAQLLGQFDQIVNNKINRINSYCDALRSVQNMQFQLDALLASLPIMEFYGDILRLVAKLANYLFNMGASLFTKLFDEPPKYATDSTYNLYSTNIGIELFYQSYELLSKSLVIPSLIRNTGGGRSRFLYKVPFRGHRGGPFGAAREVSQKLILPYALYGINGNDEATDEGRQGSYATRTAPAHLRELWGNSSPGADPNVNLGNYNSIYEERYEDYIEPYLNEIQYKPPYIGFFPSTFLSVRNINDPLEPGVRIYASVPTPSGGRTPTETNFYNDEYLLAKWNPEFQRGDVVPERNSPISYAVLLTRLIESDSQNINTGGVELPSLGSGTGAGLARPQKAIQQLVNSFFTVTPRLIDEDNPFEEADTNTDLLVLSNPKEYVEKQIDGVITTDIGKRRLPRFIYATNKEVFQVNDDVCVTASDKADAEAWMSVLQSRLQLFFINTLPLAPVYPCWNNVGTVKLITDYLYRKIYKDLQNKSLLEPLLNNFQMIEKVYSGFPLESPQFTVKSSNTPEENLKIVIEAMFVGMLNNIARTSEYTFINLSVFDQFDSEGRENKFYGQYQRSLYLFYSTIRNELKQGRYGNLGLSDEEKDLAVDQFASMIDDDNLSVTALGEQVGSYYFPISFLYANYLIFYDHSVRYGERYSEIYYRTQVEIAASDDSFLTAIRGQSYSRFSDQYIGFPVSVLTYNESYNITYYNQSQVQARIDYLNELLENPELIQLSVLERERIDNIDDNNRLLNFTDKHYRYINPSTAPEDYFTSLRQIFLDARNANFQSLFAAGLDTDWWAQEDYAPSEISSEDNEFEQLLRLKNILTDQDIRQITEGQNGPRLMSDDKLVAKLRQMNISAENKAADYVGLLFQEGVYTRERARQAPELVSIDELCTYGKVRLDNYISDITGEPPLESVEAWYGEREIVRFIVKTRALTRLQKTINYICDNTGPSLEAVREEKKTLETLINPNE